MSPASPALACFVTPHGLGHAARAAAVLAALQKREPALRVELFTMVPPAFFESSGCRNLTAHAVRTDIGFVQRGPFVSDMEATIEALDAFLPFDAALVERLAARIREAGCGAVLCDIAPLGIAVARAAGVPSILIENFRWDALYRYYESAHPRLAAHADTLQRWFDAADILIQTEPICRPNPAAALVTGTVSRPPRAPRAAVRRALGLAAGRRLVVISMGGVTARTPLLAHLAHRDDLAFVVASGAERAQTRGNVISLPLHSEFYHPDLIAAADAVLGKVGYSTLAEVYRAGVPFGYGVRPDYPEMPALVAFLERHACGLPLSDPDLGQGVTPDFIDRLLALPRRTPAEPDGAAAIAEHVLRGSLARDTRREETPPRSNGAPVKRPGTRGPRPRG